LGAIVKGVDRAGKEARPRFHKRAKVAHADHDHAAGTQQIIEVSQRAFDLFIEQQMGQGVAFADHGIEYTADGLPELQEVHLPEFNTIEDAVVFGYRSRLAQHTGAWVGCHDIVTQLGQRHRLRADATRGVQYALNALVAENRAQAEALALQTQDRKSVEEER